jgi:uncharacterized protein YjbI with pentapeptide repeats
MAADFSGANLHLATFKKADLDGCILGQANLLWADFSSAENLTSDQVITAKGLPAGQGTAPPSGNPWNCLLHHNDRLDKKFLYNYELEGNNSGRGRPRQCRPEESQFEICGPHRCGSIQGRSFQADLKGATLTNAYIAEADLQYADLRDVRWTGPENQLSMAANSKLARYNDEWLTKLDLPSDHNARLEEKNFQDTDSRGPT